MNLTISKFLVNQKQFELETESVKTNITYFSDDDTHLVNFNGETITFTFLSLKFLVRTHQ